MTGRQARRTRASSVHPPAARGTLRSGDRGSRVHDERGDIITGWLGQLLVVMAVVGLLGYELLSIAITTLTLDGDAEQVVDAAADAYDRAESRDDALEAAEAEADQRGAEVLDLVVEQDQLVVTVSRQTPTLFVHRIPGLEGTADVAATRRSRWGP